ncbi:hypothetical protein E2C01_031067 [Portunus trituberculatus]|uniref:Uncharacterized protein n=1 Tax=Portunus trituberculatus TaxID=210409 RepID=A0A5B7ES32_PORTR|nr:hypothetical protein [Portunus trituberculatus]
MPCHTGRLVRGTYNPLSDTLLCGKAFPVSETWSLVQENKRVREPSGGPDKVAIPHAILGTGVVVRIVTLDPKWQWQNKPSTPSPIHTITPLRTDPQTPTLPPPLQTLVPPTTGPWKQTQ